MKAKLHIHIQTLAAILFLLATPVARAQANPPNPPINPATGLWVATSPATAAIDPTTGLPLAPAEPEWIDPHWGDPDIILTNVVYDGLPLVEVARQLRLQFKDQFNILPMPKTFGKEWGDITIQLQLKNVRASEIFNAMNLVFENDRTPLRWKLSDNRMVQLQVLREAVPPPPPAPETGTHRMVYFMGPLVSHKEIAGRLDATPKSVSSRLERARAKLRAAMARILAHET